MLAPKIAKAHPKSPVRLTRRSSTVQGDSEQEAAKLIAESPEAGPRASWDFSKIPLFPIGRESQGQERTPLHSTYPPDVIPTRLVLNKPGDEHEQEAERVAEQVMRPLPERVLSDIHSTVRKAARAVAPRRESNASPNIQRMLRTPGHALDASTRVFMETRFGHDFRHIRVHTDADAAEAARALNARAFTVGRHIVFGKGMRSFATNTGRRLLAHELTHVLQQAGTAGGIAIQRDNVKGIGDEPASDHQRVETGSKTLAKGVMNWTMGGKHDGDQSTATVSINFVPNKSYRGVTVTFLQTVLRTRSSHADPTKMPSIDLRSLGREGSTIDDTVPFYGASWDNNKRRWSAASDRSMPTGTTDNIARMHDDPSAFAGMMKLFETVAVVPETGEPLGAIKWGLSGNDGLIAPDLSDDVSDKPTAGFLVAVDKFFAQPKGIGPVQDRDERYDTILDGFPANDGKPGNRAAILTPDQRKKIDPIAAQVKGNPDLQVEVSGFADATEKDPNGTSEARARAVEQYLIDEGVSKGSIVIAGYFGSAWARYTPGPTENRNRRVQVRARSRQ